MSNFFTRMKAIPDEEMIPSDFTPPEDFTTDDTNEINHYYFTDDADGILVGTWENPPSKQEIPSYPCHELMHVVSGSVTITGADGKSDTYVAGDTFFIAKGTPVTWENTETMRKMYMIADA